MKKLTRKDLTEFLSHDWGEKATKIAAKIWIEIEDFRVGGWDIDFDNQSHPLFRYVENLTGKPIPTDLYDKDTGICILCVVDLLCSGGWGVESIELYTNKRDPEGSKQWLSYINTGDTYSPSILLWKGQLYSGCWGDWAERYHDYQNYCVYGSNG